MKSDLFEKIDKYTFLYDETNMYDRYSLVESSNGYILNINGEEYIDLVLGYSACNLGHSNKQIVTYIKEKLFNLDTIHSFNCIEKIELSEKLVKLTNPNICRKVYFPVSGNKAVDFSLNITRHYTRKKKIISFNGAFHGLSNSSAGVTDSGYFKENIMELNSDTIFLDYPTKQNGDIVLKNFLNIINKIDDIAGIIIEPIQGAAGFIIPDFYILEKIYENCKKKGIIFIADEIQSGLGRCGKIFAYKYCTIEPDIILLSKSLAGGFYPLSAVIGKSEIFDSDNLKGIRAGSTFSNNQFGIGIANFVIDIISDPLLLDNVNYMGDYIFDKLLSNIKNKYIIDFFHIGLAFSFKTNDVNISNKIVKNSFKKHKIILQTTGINKDRVKFVFPLNVTKVEADLICFKLIKAINNI